MALAFDPSLLDFIERCAIHFSEWPELRDAAPRLRALAGTAPEPFRLAVVGRMKAGKSTLLNAIIGEPLAIMEMNEATATITEIAYGAGSDCECFEVHWKDGRTERLPISHLEDWKGTSEAACARARDTEKLRLFAPFEKLREIIIVDTPGSASVNEVHEAAIREYLEHAKPDAILYVITQARESDEAMLKLFGEGRIAADPYNSMCALHKWDNMISKDPQQSAVRRSGNLFNQLKEHMLTVLPVSGPLALAARHLPDAVFEKMALAARNCTDKEDLHQRLGNQRRYATDPTISEIIPDESVLPLLSFQMLMGGFIESPPADAAEARARCLAESHIEELEGLLDQHFFANAMTIKHCQFLRHADEILQPAFKRLLQLEAEETENIQRASRAAEALREPDLKRWAESMKDRSQHMAEHLRSQGLALQNEWIRTYKQLDSRRADLQVLRALHARDCEFPSEHHSIIRFVCGASDAQVPTLDQVRQLFGYYKHPERHVFETELIAMFRHVHSRLNQRAVQLRPSAPR